MLECNGMQSLAKCKSHLGAVETLAGFAGGLGAALSLKASLSTICDGGPVGYSPLEVFSGIAYAAPATCVPNEQNVIKVLRQAVKKARSKLDGSIARAQLQLDEARESAGLSPSDKVYAKLKFKERQYSELLKFIKENPDQAMQWPGGDVRRLSAPEREFISERETQLSEYLSDLRKVHRGMDPKTMSSLLDLDERQTGSYAGYFKGLGSNEKVMKLMRGESVPAGDMRTAAQKFLDSIKNKGAFDQRQLIRPKLEAMPELRDYFDKLGDLQRLQLQKSKLAVAEHKLLDHRTTMRSASEIVDEAIKPRLASPQVMGEEAKGALLDAEMFNDALKTAMTEDAATLSRVGSGAVARLLLARATGIGAARIGLAALGTVGSVVALAATPGQICKDGLARLNKYVVYADKSKCEIAPAIGPNTIDYLYNLPPDKQLKALTDYASDGPQLCFALEEVEDSQGPHTWSAECTSGGFRLIGKPGTGVARTALAFDTGSDGSIRKMQFTGPKMRPTEGASENFGTYGLNTNENRFEILFNNNEQPASVLTPKTYLNTSSETIFNNPNNYERTSAKDAIYGPWYKRISNVAENMKIYDSAQLAITEVQMCCSRASSTVADRCRLWNLSPAESAHMSGWHNSTR